MIIYLLDNELEKCAQYLSDADLEQQIEAIAQTLCNVHHIYIGKTVPFGAFGVEFLHDKIPDNGLYFLDFEGEEEIIKWCLECRANYEQLVKMGLACVNEYSYRYSDGFFTDDDFIFKGKVKEHQLTPVIIWARDNVPHLEKHGTKTVFINDSPRFLGMPQDEPTPFPLVMPEEYIVAIKGDPLKHPSDLDYHTEIKGKMTCCNIIESYRNYYCAKLQKPRKFRCKECKGSGKSLIDNFPCINCDSNGIVYKQITPKWFRREKPEWL